MPGIDPVLLIVLERLRRGLGRPLTIVSGFRCPEYNARVGGIKTSQHLYGRAADVPRGLFRPLAAQKAGAIGIGVRAGWVIHLDVTPGRQTFVFQD